MTLPVGASSAARKQSIRSAGDHVRNLTTSYFERKETKFVGNKTAIYSWNRSSLYLRFVKLRLLCVFSSFIQPIIYARASQEHVFDAGGSAKPKAQQRRQWEGANVRQKSPSPQTLRSPKNSWASCCYATLDCAILSKYGLLRASTRRQLVSVRCQIETSLFFRSNISFDLSWLDFIELAERLDLCRFRSKFALAGHLSLSSPWFSETTNTDKKIIEVKISSKSSTSAIASPHVKCVKEC